ncbi:ParA family protein [Candidatus Aerophobetes bacterium]|nr:ParA family protein [Candidatus Aerophobetes bacterium]
MAEIIAIANPKGGCGKTTTAINLASFIAASERKVLLIDLDPQSGATSGLGIKIYLSQLCITEVLFDSRVQVKKAIYSTKVKGLFLIPAKFSLSMAEKRLRQLIGGGLVLKEKINPVISEYDYILLDTPPSLGVLTLNALAIAHKVIVPVQTQFFALRGLKQLLNTADIVKMKINPGLCRIRVLATMYDRRTRISQSVLRKLREDFKEKVFNTVIPISTRLAEAPEYGLPVLLYDHRCNGATAYRKLAMEVIRGGERGSFES